MKDNPVDSRKVPEQHDVITLGGGCFWCVEAVYQQLEGVHAATSGYMGGHVENPTYEQVCSKTSGHVEVVQLKFDPEIIPLEDILAWFWELHDPTTKDRQGHDIGTQYRSAIFWLDDEQRASAASWIERLTRDKVFGRTLVTELSPGQDSDGSGAPGGHRYYPAEAYHQRYFERHPGEGYCRIVVAPKLAGFRKRYRELLQR